MWVIVRYDDERFLGQVLQKVNGQVEVRCLKEAFGICHEPQEFEKERLNCFHWTVYRTSITPKPEFYKRAYRWIYWLLWHSFLYSIVIYVTTVSISLIVHNSNCCVHTCSHLIDWSKMSVKSGLVDFNSNLQWILHEVLNGVLHGLCW